MRTIKGSKTRYFAAWTVGSDTAIVVEEGEEQALKSYKRISKSVDEPEYYWHGFSQSGEIVLIEASKGVFEAYKSGEIYRVGLSGAKLKKVSNYVRENDNFLTTHLAPKSHIPVRFA